VKCELESLKDGDSDDVVGLSDDTSHQNSECKAVSTVWRSKQDAYGASNGHVTDVVTWTWKVKIMTLNTLGAQYLENN